MKKNPVTVDKKEISKLVGKHVRELSTDKRYCQLIRSLVDKKKAADQNEFSTLERGYLT
jgi:hypothetical protein